MWERLLASRAPQTQANNPDTSDMIVEKADEKLADKDYDGDGKLETPEEEYKGSVDKAIKRASGDEEDEDQLDKKDTHDESVDHYIEQTLKDVAALGRERWFRNTWRRERALLEACATGEQTHQLFEHWTPDDFWRALIGVEREFYGLN